VGRALLYEEEQHEPEGCRDLCGRRAAGRDTEQATPNRHKPPTTKEALSPTLRLILALFLHFCSDLGVEAPRTPATLPALGHAARGLLGCSLGPGLGDWRRARSLPAFLCLLLAFAFAFVVGPCVAACLFGAGAEGLEGKHRLMQQGCLGAGLRVDAR
jgi:hypothetical protein